MEDERRGARQSAYHVEVATDPGQLTAGTADLWDSGRIESGESHFIEYAGTPLRSRQRVWWRVRVWDEEGRESVSEPSWWEMGLLERSDWSARWIGADLVGGPYAPIPCPHLRRRFTVEGAVQSARLYVTALGLHRTSLNGVRTSEEELSPGWTNFRKRVRYSVHDVTKLLQPGENILGAILGDGWYCGHLEKRQRQLYGDRPRLLAQLEVRYADGREERIISDENWRVGFGPVLASDLIMGEEYDARLEMPGWDRPAFDAARWQPARVFPDPGLELSAWEGPPIRRIEEVPAVADPRPGRRGGHIFDLGQNLVGRIRLTVEAPAGTTLRLRYAERLEPDGSLHTANLRTARATDHYTCRGGGPETWEAHFTFHGFQYVEVTGLPKPPARDAVVGVVLHSDCPQTGEFACSHELVNRLFSNIRWGWKGNSLDVPTDCPQRDERLGWTGDAQVFAATAACVADVNGFFAKWLRDLREHQGADGAVAGVVPHSHLPGDWGDGGPGWADAMIVCPAALYAHYGDRRMLEEHYPALQRWMAQQERTSRDGLRAYEGSQTPCYGDWLALDGSGETRGATPHDLIGTAFFAHAAQTMARLARALGHEDDARQYTALRDRIGQAFQRQFLTPDGHLRTPTQTAAVLALQFDLVPDAARGLVAAALEEDIRRRGMQLATGFLGTPYLLRVLAREGRIATAYALLLQTRCPSWLYAVTQGATTIWERWDGWTPEKGFQNPGMNSFNHYAFGAVGEWLISDVAGIAPDPENAGMQTFLLEPRPGPGLEWARCHLETPYGRIESAWRRQGAELEWEVLVPPNTSALVRWPCAAPEAVREGNLPLSRCGGVDSVSVQRGSVCGRLAAGRYHFHIAARKESPA